MPTGSNALDRKRRQHGAALLAMMVLVGLWGLYLFVGQLSATQLRLAHAQNSAAALAEAKEALIGRAATDDNRPGSLPCPALNDNGVAPLLVGNNCPTYIGRLPWSTLRIGDLRDGAGEILWYALAPALRDDDSAQPINSQMPAVSLTLNGAPNVAAIVFAPGAALEGQLGRPGGTVTNYLDGSNSDGDSNYVSVPPTQLFNDQVLAVTRDDLFGRVVKQRVLGELLLAVLGPTPIPSWGLRKYHADNGTLPSADTNADGYGDGVSAGTLPYNDLVLLTGPASSPLQPPYSWLVPNGWLPLVTYERLSANSARLRIDNITRAIIVP